MDADKKIVYIQDIGISNARPFNVVQVKRYHPPTYIAHSLFNEVRQGFRYLSSDTNDEVFLIEVLNQSYPRSRSPEIFQDKRAEICGLFERRTFKVI